MHIPVHMDAMSASTLERRRCIAGWLYDTVHRANQKKVKDLYDGHGGSELPDSMFVKKFNFDGHGFDLRRKSTSYSGTQVTQVGY